MNQQSLYFTHYQSPVGALLLAGTPDALHFISFPTGHKAFGPASNWQKSQAPFKEVIRQLKAYFDGELTRFQLPYELDGTPFQQKVWQTLPQISYGKTKTYGWLANEIGSPKASRAVGAANGNNPLPIILPCHRVIGANGTMTGFGGGIKTKKFLLKLEGYKFEQEQLSLL